jgi:Ca2+/Na+ antiporter
VGGFVQLLFLLFAYGAILFAGSTHISDGSELLLLIPEWAGLVGSIVLPVLGAVPDGAIVLFSGLGPDAQTQLDVGVGALAGSTIMLLTIPWCMSVVGGRVSLAVGSGRSSIYSNPKLNGNEFGWVTTGVEADYDSVSTAALWMAATAVPFFVIQVPSFIAPSRKIEGYAAAVGAILCLCLFCGYLWAQFVAASDPIGTAAQKRLKVMTEKVLTKQISLSAAVYDELDTESGEGSSLMSTGAPVSSQGRSKVALLVKPFFQAYDKSRDGQLSKNEFGSLMQDLGESPAALDAGGGIDGTFKSMDTDDDGKVSWNEFVDGLVKYVQQRGPGAITLDDEAYKANQTTQSPSITVSVNTLGGDMEDQNDFAEEETVPEDLKNLSVADQQRLLLNRAFLYLFGGTAVVLLFSDPMVDVLSEVGVRTQIPAFYIAFVLAPLASNASEVVASYAYAQKKTTSTITISFVALLGAASMNNSFCLCIFLALVSLRYVSATPD